MTFQALNTAITGLRAAQAQLSVISNNVTNATTPGYNRQILPQETQLLRESGQTVGVLTGAVIRTVDMNLQRDLWTQISAASMQDVQVQYLQKIQDFNGPPEKEFSIAAKIAQLRDSFSALSDIPDDVQALQATLDQAHIVADKFNDYSALLTQLRNDTQGDLQTSVNRVNSLLEEITNINIQIRGAENFNNSVAGLQDERDIAIKALTEEMDITFFERSDGVLVVQTKEGMQLAGDYANRLDFESVPLSANQYYPNSASGLIVVSIANGRETRTDITDRVIGGKIGGLLTLRDETIPSYHAQLDELAYQMAFRFEAQGLTLFTDQSGSIPLGTAPDPTTLPLPTPVPYVDFARTIRVNRDIDNDITLLQSGTYNSDITLPSGDNSVIRRVLEFGFGDINYQEAVGSSDLVNIGVAVDLQEWLGLYSTNKVIMGVDFSSFSEIDDGIAGTNDLIESVSSAFPGYPANDEIQITFEEARGVGFGPTTISLDLSNAQANFPIGPGINNALDQIIAEINSQAALAGLTPDQAMATTNNYGQLVIQSRGNVTIAGTGFANAMGTTALDVLGIAEGTFVTEDPNFNVQIGNDTPVNITIEPGDTFVELQAKLEYNTTTGTGVPGLFVDIDAITGFLTLRPGVDDSNWGPLDTAPLFGGDIRITGGPFATDTAVNGFPDNVSIVGALFGSFSAGPPVTETSPISTAGYSFEITNGSGTFTNIRNQFLGPNAAISTGIFSSSNLIDYAQKMIDETSQDYLQAQSAFENEDTLRGIVQRQFSDDSGVNIDEEMSNLIVVQTAYAAAARAITAADEMFQELINAFRR
ncbi:MAG TPA: flagellar hook-associated protein FlgK [Alphaproteobacteria bacterium]|nr:flagellar hook-associated protein FlgK [Alphaproteobacteria bacterium]